MALPTMIQHIAGSNIRGALVNNNGVYRIALRNPTLAGNCLIMGGQSAGTTVTISDDKGNTWTAGPTVTDVANGITGFIWYALNVAAGTRVISIKNTSGSTQAWFGAKVTEFNNVATVSAGDGSNSHTATGTSITAGSITPGTTGDLLYQYTFLSGTVSTASWAAGSQANIGWALLSSDRVDGQAAQWGIYNATSAINATMTSGTSSAYVSMVIALKSASAGYPQPSGMQIVRCIHQTLDESIAGFDANPWTMQLPMTGNLLVAMFMLDDPTHIATGISDSLNGAWSRAGTGSAGAGQSFGDCWYRANAQSSPSMTITITFAVFGSAVLATVVFYDIIGAAVTPLDTTQGDFGTQTVAGDLTTAAITPTTSPGIILGTLGVSLNTANGLAGASQFFDSVTYDGETLSGPQNCDQNNGWGHYYNASTDPVIFTWKFVSATLAADLWGSFAVAFKAAPIVTPTLMADIPVQLRMG